MQIMSLHVQEMMRAKVNNALKAKKNKRSRCYQENTKFQGYIIQVKSN